MDNPILKRQLQTLLEMGVTSISISRQTGIKEGSIRHWLSGIRNLSDENEEKLKAYIVDLKQKISTL